MFEQAVLSTGPASKRVWTTFAGISGQALLVTIAVMIPMIWPEAMSNHQGLLRVFIPGVPPGPPPKGDADLGARPTRAVPKQWTDAGLHLPVRSPDHVVMIEDPPDVGVAHGSGVGVPGGMGIPGASGVWSGITDSLNVLPVAPPVPEHHAAATPAPEPVVQRIRQGGLVDMGEPIHRVEPIYPRLAAMAHVAGVVELEAVVGVDGHIRELKVKSGSPLLVPAAVEAVRQWVYRPTRLNSVPVEIIAPITITFRLN